MNDDRYIKNVDFTVKADGAKWRTRATVDADGVDTKSGMRVSYEGPAATPGPDGYAVYRLPEAIADRIDQEAEALEDKHKAVDFTLNTDGAQWRTRATVGPKGLNMKHAMQVDYKGPAVKPGPDGYAVYRLPEAIADRIDEERRSANPDTSGWKR